MRRESLIYERRVAVMLDEGSLVLVPAKATAVRLSDGGRRADEVGSGRRSAGVGPL